MIDSIEDMASLTSDMLGGGHGHGGHGGHGVKPVPTVIPTPIHYELATKTGRDALYVVFAIMLIASALFSLLAWRLPVSKRLYHVLTTIITLTAAVSYYAMATGSSFPLHCARVRDSHDNVPDTHHLTCRQVFWPRYADWAITTPLLIADLCLLAGIDGAHTLMAIVADLIMVLTGLFAALAKHEKTRWGWFAMGCVAYLFVVWHVAVPGVARVKARGSVGKVFYFLALWTAVIWTIYPIVWGISEGAAKMTVNQEIIAYAVLDVLAKPVFGLVLLVAHSRIPETNVDVGGYWAHGLSSEGSIRLRDDEDV